MVEGKVSLLVGGRKTGWWKEKLFYEPITPTFTPLVHGASVALKYCKMYCTTTYMVVGGSQ